MTPTPPVVPPQQRIFGTSAEERRRNVRVIGSQRYRVRDLYYTLLSTSWRVVIGLVTAVFLGINALFGFGFFLLGGVANADPHSFWDHFFFSVHTFATIGYGSMYPQSPGAEVLMTIESVLSLFMNAMVTGLSFARFARPTAKVTWSKVACVCDRDGVPTLVIRVANERLNHVVDAAMNVAIIRGEVTREGEKVRRVHDLPLQRNTSPSFILTWLAMHPITKDSPLYGLDAGVLSLQEAEIVVTLTGLDETLGQTIHSRTSYVASDLRFGERFVDVIGWLMEGTERKRVIDLTKFHDTQPASLSREVMGLP